MKARRDTLAGIATAQTTIRTNEDARMRLNTEREQVRAALDAEEVLQRDAIYQFERVAT